MLIRLKRWLTKTLYRQLVLGVVLTMAFIMSVFAWVITQRQETVEFEQLVDQALALTDSVANSSEVWVVSRDFSGLQEIVQGLQRYPGLRYAMVLDVRGQVLAHSEPARIGQFLTDLPVQIEVSILQRNNPIDVIRPIMLSERHIGWIRIGLGHEKFNLELVKIRRDAVFFTLLAVALSAVFVAFSVRYLTRRLRAVQQVANAVQAGQFDLRADVSGQDEAAQLAHHFNAMLDQLVVHERALKDSEMLLNATQSLGKIGGWQWDLAQETLTWTLETFRIHDMSPDLAAQKGFDHIAQSVACYLPKDREILLQTFWRCVKQGEPYDLEMPFTTTQNRSLWIRTTGQAIYSNDRIVKVFGYIMDITERHKLQIIIKEEALYARNLIETSLDPLVTINAEGKITDANKATERATGISHVNLIGSDFANYFTDPDKARASYLQVFSKGVVVNYPLALRHLSGTVMDVLYNASVYRDSSDRILGVFAAARDITDLKKLQDEISQLAFFDPLTKLPNRRTLTDRLSQAMAASQRSGYFAALMYLDLDNFKPVNDHYGHAVGDLLLIEVATRLTSCVRQVDTVGRTGGDEFVVILGNLSTDQAKADNKAVEIAENIRSTMSQAFVLTIQQPGRQEQKITHCCTASIGVTLFHGHDASQEDIMKWADTAMYQAKNAGRNRVQFYVPLV